MIEVSESGRVHIGTMEMDSFLTKFYRLHVNLDTLKFLPTGIQKLAIKPHAISGYTLDARLSLFQSLGGKYYILLCDEETDITDAEWEHLLKENPTKKEAIVSSQILENSSIKIIGSNQVMLEKYAKRLNFAGDLIEFFKTKKSGEQITQRFVAENLHTVQSIANMIVNYSKARYGQIIGVLYGDLLVLLGLFASNKMLNKKELIDKTSNKAIEHTIKRLNRDGFLVIMKAENNASKVKEQKKYGLTAKGYETVFKIMEAIEE